LKGAVRQKTGRYGSFYQLRIPYLPVLVKQVATAGNFPMGINFFTFTPAGSPEAFRKRFPPAPWFGESRSAPRVSFRPAQIHKCPPHVRIRFQPDRAPGKSGLFYRAVSRTPVPKSVLPARPLWKSRGLVP